MVREMEVDYYTSGGVGASIIVLVGVIWKIVSKLNHKTCKSDCMGRKMEITLDVNDTRDPSTVENAVITVKESQH